MAERRRSFLRAAGTGVAAFLLFAVAWALVPRATADRLREQVFDTMLAHARGVAASERHPSERPVVVVDVDEDTLERSGSWPWSRRNFARLVEAIAARHPAVTGFDIVFAEDDRRSPAALARRLGEMTKRPDITRLAEGLEDDDALLAGALRSTPSVLGFALDPDRPGPIDAKASVLVRGEASFGDLWQGAGALGPASALLEAAVGLGAVSLPGDEDGVVRRVPLLVGIDGRLHPGIVLETLRVAEGATSFLVDADDRRLHVGGVSLSASESGLTRLVPHAEATPAVRIVSASALLEGLPEADWPPGAIVLVGSSAPEAGGLRTSVYGPLTPSVVILANGLVQSLRGIEPKIVEVTPMTAFAVAALAAAAAILAAAVLSPVAGLAVLAGCLAALWAGALVAAGRDLLVDPTGPTAAALFAHAAAAASTAITTRRRERMLRRRFSMHLAPQVVEMIVADPSLLKLGGRRQDITALFTDLEGFTAMVSRADPDRLIRLLDAYFEGIAHIVLAHGGMIDKFVGDSVHAFFGMPIETTGHAEAAVDCAIAIGAWTDAFRDDPLAADLGLGRTRIGVESGPAIVGEVGLRSKLDFTAHGTAVNTAARLEAANKRLGSTICIGPVAASRCPPALLRPIGRLSLAGLDGPLETFGPWPPGVGEAWRRTWCEADGLLERDAEAAIRLLADLAMTVPEDGVLLRRLSAGHEILLP